MGVYQPRFLSQLGWNTSHDLLNCTMATASIALDRHTLGRKRSTPPAMRAFSGDTSGGTSIYDAAAAWRKGYGETLDLAPNISWDAFKAKVKSGRGALVAGDCHWLNGKQNCPGGLNENHSIYVNEVRSDGQFLIYDPSQRQEEAGGRRVISETTLKAYAGNFAGTGRVTGAFTGVTASVSDAVSPIGAIASTRSRFGCGSMVGGGATAIIGTILALMLHLI